MKKVKAAFVIAGTIAFVFLFSQRMYDIPPVGEFLSPFQGFWRNADPMRGSQEDVIGANGISSKCVVKFDKNRVPHIFASNDHDLYFSQGYITARDRLWQMDVEVRTAEGRLSEVFGQRTLSYDILHRRRGLLYSAKRAIDSVMKDSISGAMLAAYADGVNAYIDGLSPAQYPIEFKLFGYKPEKWSPINSLLVLKLLGETLTADESEFGMSDAYQALGNDVARALYKSPTADHPVIPRKTRWDFSPVERIPKDDPAAQKKGDGVIAIRHIREGIGSNSWVVSGARTQDGFPLLENDPHLQLTAPSTWYQIQLYSKSVNVCGVSIPGIPSVIIGCNKSIAWGITNEGADVVDWYRIRFKDSTKCQYRYNGRWEQTERHIEQIKVRDGKMIEDTVQFTVEGPVVYDASHPANENKGKGDLNEGLAMRWTLHEISNDLKTFFLLNRAKNFDEYQLSLIYLSCPALNVVFAGPDNTISVNCTGKLPLRYNGQGIALMDGSDPEEEWHGWIPPEQLPSCRNPTSGYVVAANQELTDSLYPYYIGGRFAPSYRADRINERLAEMHHCTIDSFRLLQKDKYSVLAAGILPVLLKELDPDLSKKNLEVINELQRWDYKFDETSKAATVFDEWWDRLYGSIWRDRMRLADGEMLPWPDFVRTCQLLNSDTLSYWIDNHETAQKKTISSLVNRAFQDAIANLIKRKGSFSDSWTWGNNRSNVVRHLGGVPGFGIGPYSVGGAPNCIDAETDYSGPSWRMVVEVGKTVNIYGSLPGGESGNPGSFYYDNLFGEWKSGRLEKMLFLDSAEQSDRQIISTLILNR